MTKPCDVALCNTSDDCSHGQWGNIVLKHLYQSLGDGNGGIEGCIREALIHYPKHNHTTTVMVGSTCLTNRFSVELNEVYSKVISCFHFH